MKLQQYRNEITRTLVNLNSLEQNILHMTYGLQTEVGELQDIFKKELAYGKSIDLVNIKEEIGDMLWYCCNIMNFMQTKEEDIIKYDFSNFGFSVKDNILLMNFYLGELSLRSTTYVDGKISLKDKSFLTQYNIKIFLLLNKLCQRYNWYIDDIFEININKLKVRFPDKFSQEKALNRDLEGERRELEK